MLPRSPVETPMASGFHTKIILVGIVALAVDARAAGDVKEPSQATTREEAEEGGPPPSKTLDHAKKLYDRGEYYSASIELDKALKGNEDSEPNKQKAEFFMGKDLFHLRYYAAALVYFDNIVQKGPSHPYYLPTLH